MTDSVYKMEYLSAASVGITTANSAPSRTQLKGKGHTSISDGNHYVCVMRLARFECFECEYAKLMNRRMHPAVAASG